MADGVKETLIDAYRLNLEIWNTQMDTYFKRVQITMMAIQGILLAGALTIASKSPLEAYQLFIMTVISLAGIATSLLWHRLINKAHRFLEFCRRALRSIESQLADVGVPIQYFILESHVFGKKAFAPRDLPTGQMLKDEGNGKGYVIFHGKENERYPEDAGTPSLHTMNKSASLNP